MMKGQSRLSPVRYVAHGIFLFVLFIMQFTKGFCPLFFGQPAELLLMGALLIALFEDENVGLIAGLVAGILTDICMIGPAGYHALFFMLLGVTFGILRRNYLTNNIIVGIAFVLSGTLFYKLIDWLIFYAFRGYGHAFAFFFRYYLVSVVFTVILAVPAYFILKFYRRLFKFRAV